MRWFSPSIMLCPCVCCILTTFVDLLLFLYITDFLFEHWSQRSPCCHCWLLIFLLGQLENRMKIPPTVYANLCRIKCFKHVILPLIELGLCVENINILKTWEVLSSFSFCFFFMDSLFVFSDNYLGTGVYLLQINQFHFRGIYIYIKNLKIQWYLVIPLFFSRYQNLYYYYFCWVCYHICSYT